MRQWHQFNSDQDGVKSHLHFAIFASALIYTAIVWKMCSVVTYWLGESYAFCVIELQNK